MNKVVNGWWLLPVFTLGIGIIIAITTQSSQTSTVVNASVQPTVAAPAKQLVVTQVALPPAPVAYQPTLTATIENNRVVVEKQPVRPKSTSNELASNSTSQHDESDGLNAQQSKLAAQFSQVMQDMADEEAQPKPAAKLHAQPLTLYPQWYQDLVPELEFSSHIYSSNANDRWVKVNDQVVKEGELINSAMRLVDIEPQQVIIEMQQRRFSLPALSSW